MLDLVSAYSQMCQIRFFEDEVYRLFLQNLVKGSTHLGSGQEAVAVGFSSAINPNDYVLATYRGHAHVLARGVPPGPMFAEMMGKEAGLNRGRGGSMHLTSVDHRMMGCYAIVGSHLPIANGIALTSKLRNDGTVVVCFFGDGTTNIGAFHEALNLASVWKLPVVFVCENNLYMEYTPISEMIAVEHPAADRAASYGLERIIVDGNDVTSVHAEAARIVADVRAGRGPALVEAMTYRSGGHSRADPGIAYRPAKEIEAWQARDPLTLTRQRLLQEGQSLDGLERLEQELRDDIALAAQTALAEADADPGTVVSDLWADGSAAWRR